MKRLFCQTKIYDYTSEKEAERDIQKMKESGWFAKEHDGGNPVYNNGQDDFPYSVEYHKEK